MYFNVIASGSKGNATLIGNKDTLIQIDMGVSLTTLKDGLNEISKKVNDIEGVFITHDHSDHIKGLKYISDREIYALKGTLNENYNILSVYNPINVGSFKITPIKTIHDAKNPCGFMIEDGKEKLVYITDTGCIPNQTLEVIKNPDYLIFESNHDLEMLMDSDRTMALKNRIKGDFGHLSNDDSALFATFIVGNKTKEIVLAHLSEECNTEEKALAAYQRVFKLQRKSLEGINLRCAKQYRSTLGGDYEI